MADVRPFRALRYDPALADPALAIAPPYDVITPAQQQTLYARSPYNVVRIEYGVERPGDSERDNRYTRAAADLRAFVAAGMLRRDGEPAIYTYRQEFAWEGARHVRQACFAAVRLEAWEKGVVKPHEHTLAKPKADRLNLLRATRTQISPVYCIFRARDGAADAWPPAGGDPLVEFQADGERHALHAVHGEPASDLARRIGACDLYIADGHHRYETALAYRDEVRAGAAAWTGEEPENFVLVALTHAADPGLLVLPTHRIVNPPAFPPDALDRIARRFEIEDVTPKSWDGTGLLRLLARLEAAKRAGAAIAAIGLEEARLHLLVLRDRAGVEALMPPEQPAAWKQLDVNVLQYAVLQDVFGIDEAALAAGGAVTYTQDAREAHAAVEGGQARMAFLLNATPVEQVLAVADAGGRMPQKSTYFHPKLPTGLVLNTLEP